MVDESGKLSRRAMLGVMGAGALVAMLPEMMWAESAAFRKIPTRAEIEAILKTHLKTAKPEMMRFAVDVFEKCIYGRMQAAEAPLKNPWLVPGGIYVGQWLWDTTFLTDLLAIVPEERDFLRGIYRNFWDAQARWDGAMPEYARGMVANFIAPDSGPEGFSGKTWKTFPAYSQAPILAWGVERVFRRNGDLTLVREALGPLEKFHDWYWRERDLDDVGLVTVGCYDGSLQHARYETYDNEVDLDTLRMIAHPKRKAGAENGEWYGDIYIPANTGYLLLSERALIRMAEAAGEHALAARRKPILEKGVAAMRKQMWSEEQGCFLAVRRGDWKQLPNATVGGFVPLQGKVATEKQAARMAAALKSEHWNTGVPIPSVDAKDAAYKSDGFWRGDVWPSSVFQTLDGLAQYGHGDVVESIAVRVIENALKVGISEHYDSHTGAPLGVPNLGMSGVILTMALEGMSAKHKIEVI